MTFTEAAVEILRRNGTPAGASQITQAAIEAGLLSHVGQTPEETMGARLAAMARMEHDRVVCLIGDDQFALTEWGLVPAEPVAVVEPEAPSEADALPYRGRERHPPVREEFVPGGRREDRRRHRDDEGEGRRRRYQPPGEVAWQLLRERGEPMSLAEMVAALRANDKVAEALERDLGSFEKALREESRRRQDAGRGPLFEFGPDGVVKALEPREPRKGEGREGRDGRDGRRDRGDRGEGRGDRREERAEPRAEVRPAALEEQRRQVLRTLRRRLNALDISALERVCVALLESQGYRELNLGRRSAKEGPLYLARHRWGATDLRYAVRVLRPGRDLGRTEVQELRRDLSHFSAQLGVVFATGDCSREARGESNSPGQAPVMLYGGEALAEALLDAGLGATRRMVEWIEFDDEFFVQAGAGEPLDERSERSAGFNGDGSEPREPREPRESRESKRPAVEESTPVESPVAETAAEPAVRPEGEEPSNGRERRRRRDRRRNRREGETPTATPAATTPANGGATTWGEVAADDDDEPSSEARAVETAELVETVAAVEAANVVEAVEPTPVDEAPVAQPALEPSVADLPSVEVIAPQEEVAVETAVEAAVETAIETAAVEEPAPIVEAPAPTRPPAQLGLFGAIDPAPAAVEATPSAGEPPSDDAPVA